MPEPEERWAKKGFRPVDLTSADPPVLYLNDKGEYGIDLAGRPYPPPPLFPPVYTRP